MKKIYLILSLILISFSISAEPADSIEAVENAGQAFLLRAAEYKGYQIPATDRLRNQTLSWSTDENAISSITTGTDGMVKSFKTDDIKHITPTEIFELANEVFYFSFPMENGARALTIVADRKSGQVIEIESRRPNPEENTHRAQVEVKQALLSGAENKQLEPLQTTDGMAGVRLIAHYSDDIAYEHIYLNPHRVTWHGVTGPETGVADTEWYDAYRIREDLYLVSWSEKVLTTHMIFLFNFATGHEIGTIFGYEPEHKKAVIETIGAKTEVSTGPKAKGK